jgi:hypothetical protein
MAFYVKFKLGCFTPKIGWHKQMSKSSFGDFSYAYLTIWNEIFWQKLGVKIEMRDRDRGE